jgi:hypothetical protein
MGDPKRINELTNQRTGSLAGYRLAVDKVGEPTAEWFDADDIGGATVFDATIGASGADFTTIQAAVAAGALILAQIDNVTETGNTALASGERVQIFGNKNHTITLAGNTISGPTDSSITFLDSIITYDDPTASAITVPCEIARCEITSLSSTVGKEFIKIGAGNTVNITDCKYTGSNNQNSLVDGGDLMIKGLHLVGGGASCYDIIKTSVSPATITGLLITGTWSTTLSITDFSDSTVMSDVRAGSVTCVMEMGRTCTGIYGTNLTLKNIRNLSNFVVKAFSTFFAGHGITNGSVTDKPDFTADRFTVMGVWFVAGADVSSDWNAFYGCRCGAPAGGVDKFTVTGDNNDFVDSRVEVTLSDSGAGNVNTRERVW